MALNLLTWQRCLVNLGPSGTIEITENGEYDVSKYATADVSVSGGQVDVGDLLPIHHCVTNIAVNDEYYPEYNFEGIESISYESTELANSSPNGFAPENGIASGLTITTVAALIIENTITFFKLTVESNTVTAIDDITDDIDYSVIAGEESSSIQLVVPSSELFSQNEYFAVTYQISD